MTFFGYFVIASGLLAVIAVLIAWRGSNTHKDTTMTLPNETSQDQEIADIIGNALFGWAYDRIGPDSQTAVQNVLQALHDHQYVITKVELPPTP